MKHLIPWCSAVLALVLTGCPSLPQATGVAPLRDVGDVVEHTPSGMLFPSSQGEFTRVSVRQYDAAGLDVSAGYNFLSPSLPVAITVYVYPSPPVRSFGSPADVVSGVKRTLAQGEFQRVKNEIKQAHQDARILAEEEIVTPALEAPRSGYFARFGYFENFASQALPVESTVYLYCYVGGEWTVKFRITHPEGANAQPIIDRFLQNLKWTIKEPNQSPQPTRPTGG